MSYKSSDASFSNIDESIPWSALNKPKKVFKQPFGLSFGCCAVT